MSEYTPTTEEVKVAYVRHVSKRFPNDDLKTEFDRWLAEHDRQVKAEAWDEGFSTGEAYGKAVGVHGGGWVVPSLDNPYSKAVTE